MEVALPEEDGVGVDEVVPVGVAVGVDVRVGVIVKLAVGVDVRDGAPVAVAVAVIVAFGVAEEFATLTLTVAEATTTLLELFPSARNV